ncbi:hypothetical protein [Sunxiuqinia indica]|uniref:hypothetical protein n=1 Tax=Sunxiuqinia indica TaxID=2692584 RepID=UPI00135C5CC8|nr:hypothetical protein [Sunxiuqinia indica]
MNASEARKLAIQNQMDKKQALELIESTSKTGGTSLMFYNLKQEAVTELMREGFKFTLHTDPINGCENIICSW